MPNEIFKRADVLEILHKTLEDEKSLYKVSVFSPNGSTATCLPQAPTSTTKTAISSTFPSIAKNCLLSLAAQHP